ncbi:MAG: hypothetical protein H7196_00880 [candidate division SR1 bacterium]|nr:hypothetical protein [candidate division SR1 bacterium]
MMHKFEISLFYVYWHKLQTFFLYAGPLLSFFELIKVEIFRQTQNSSWLLWLTFALMSAGSVIYGMHKKNLVYTINNFVNLLICIAIVSVLILGL